MGAVLIVFELIILAAVCVWLLRHYASLTKTPWYALASTWLGWLLCFSIVFLVPIDILNMDYDRCMNSTLVANTTTTNSTNSTNITNSTDIANLTASYYTNITYSSASSSSEEYEPIHCEEPITSLPNSYMQKQWKVLWWGTMILSWLGFPLLSSFFQASHFTTWERCVRALKENIILYAVLGAIGIIAVIVLYTKSGLTRDAFLALMLSLANAYGLVLTVVLMGYGLVDIPRYLWRKANRSDTLRYYCVMAFKYKEGIEQSKEDLLKTLKTVKAISDRVNDHDPYRPYVDVILSKCPGDFGDISGEGDIELSYQKLVGLHQKVREDTHNVARAVCLYEQMLKKAFKTEDVIRTRMHKQPDWRIYWSFIPARTHRFAKLHNTWEYFWQVYLFTSILRIFAVFFGILSLLIVWSEITLTSQSHNLSPFANMITGIPITGFAKQLYCLIVIFYMALCAYTTLFKIKIFNFYRLVPHQMSDAGSIMFSANYLCRLAAPLAYNFLSIVHIKDDNFDVVMGSMATSGLRDFNIGFPVLVVVLCLMSVFNVYSKIGAMCCIKKLRYRPDNDELLIDAGEKILAEARETKEGKGPVQLSTKESWKSNIREEMRDVSKLAHNNSEDRLIEKEQNIQMQQDPIMVPPVPTVTAPPKEQSVYSAMAAKYGGRTTTGPGELLPPTSRFAKRKNSLDPTSFPPAGTSSIKHNLSAGNLPEMDVPPTSGMRHNLSNNNLAQAAPPTTTGNAFTKFLSIKPTTSTMSSVITSNTPTATTTTATTTTSTRITTPANSGITTASTTNITTTSPLPSLAATKPVRTSSSNYDSLLPATSRFAQKAPAPAPAAILADSSSPDFSDSASLSNTGKQADTKSLLGNLFGKPKFELIPKSPNNQRG